MKEELCNGCLRSECNVATCVHDTKVFACKCGKVVAKIIVGSLIQKGAVIVCGECNKKPDLFSSIFGKIK